MRSTLEGLEHSGGPCARVLSVAGFFDVPGLFPLGSGFILRVNTSLFLSGKPTRVDVPFNVAHLVRLSTSMVLALIRAMGRA